MFQKIIFVLLLNITLCLSISAQSKSYPQVNKISKTKINLNKTVKPNAELGKIEFNIYQEKNLQDFNVQFLNPVYQKLEMYLINQSGDKILEVLSPQYLNIGVKTFGFKLPETSSQEMNFLVIKADEKTLLKVVEAQK